MSASGMLDSSPLEVQLLGILDKLETLRRENGPDRPSARPSMITEVRTLELWRSVIAECLGIVFYVFLICGAYRPWTGKSSAAEVQIAIPLVAGLGMAAIVHSFGQVSGGHINPAVTLAMAVTQKVSPLRAVMFILAQLGGAIAGAALLYGATSTGYRGDLGATVVSRGISPWQGFGIEFLLTFVVVFVYFASVSPYRRNLGSPAVAIGLAYLSCTVVGLPLTGASMNPARSFGPAFVINRWTSHWVYWAGPLLGGISAGLIYEYIFNPHRAPSSRKESMDGDSSSVGSDEDAYDECSKPPPRYNYNALRTQHYEQYHPGSMTHASPLGFTPHMYGNEGTSVYSSPPYKYDTSYAANRDDIYSGSKSLYAKSPDVPRSANLNRSQSVYTRPNPPRTDTYPRNKSHSICTKSPEGFSALAHNDNNYNKNKAQQENIFVSNKAGIVKPEPVYGVTTYSAKPHPDSADSTYSTYRGSYSSSRSSGATGTIPLSRARTDAHTPNSIMSGHSGLITPSSITSYHSPNPQY